MIDSHEPGSHETGHHPDHDELLAELRLLLDAVAGRAEEYLRSCGQNDVRNGCGWCPLCAALSLVRGHRPELNEHLLGLVQLLREAVGGHSGQPTAEPEPEGTAAPKVQRIAVHRVTGPVEAGA